MSNKTPNNYSVEITQAHRLPLVSERVQEGVLKLFVADQLTVLTGASSSYPGEGEATNCEPLVQQARGGGGFDTFLLPIG